MRIVDRNLDKIYNLTLNLLAYSRPREPKLEMVNPKQLINECLELIATAANEKGAMVLHRLVHLLPERILLAASAVFRLRIVLDHASKAKLAWQALQMPYGRLEVHAV